jgi:3-carboxy-cis,cis-muconate cycloisomerase
MATAFDSGIFGPLFQDEEVSELFQDSAYVRAMVDVESALARAEARLGIIPSSAGERISAAARPEKINLAKITKGTMQAGMPVIALVQALRDIVGPEAAPYVHWGATTQDIMDTASVLQLRSAAEIFKSRLTELSRYLEELADRHRLTVLAGRTHGQQAVPVSFGLKVATWLAPIVRHRERLDAMSPRVLVVQFGGAAGTLAALGDKGLAVMKALAQELALAMPVAPWHTQRDGMAEFAGWLSLVTGSLAKMAQDIILLGQTEVGEAAEAAEPGRGGSSTMPQKSNPIASELIIAAARTNASLLSAMHHALIQEHERATHGWQMEWLALPQMILLTSGALKHGLFLAKNLQVDETKMRENLRRANDLVLAEAAVFALSNAMPRSKAHELVQKACGIAVSEGKPLIEVVRRLAGDAAPKAALDWNALAEPANYLGETQKMIDRVLKGAAKHLG